METPRLDEQQGTVYEHQTGAAVVAAGPGSGKTHTVANRIAKRIEQDGIDPEQCLLLTFTNKACREMSERIDQMLGPEVERLPYIMTFHTLGRALVQMNPEVCGRERNPTLIDADEARKHLVDCLKMTFEVSQGSDVQQAVEVQEWYRNEGLDVEDPEDRARIEQRLRDRTSLEPGPAIQGFELYELSKRQSNLLDFDDLILLPSKALAENPEWADQVREHFQDVTVDEAQDTNAAQFSMLEGIAPKTTILVGDDDQSIYRWRYARPDLMASFAEKFDATLFRLENNYRSQPEIVASAASLIKGNQGVRIDKTTRAVQEKTQALAPRLILNDELGQMNQWIAEDVRRRIDDGQAPESIMILYRTHALAEGLEAALKKQNVPTQMQEGTDLLSRAEVRMLSAFARLLHNPQDYSAFERVAKIIPGLGAKGVEQTIMNAKAYECSPFEVEIRKNKKAAAGVEQLGQEIRAFREQDRGPAEVPRFAFKESRLFQQYLWGLANQKTRKKGEQEAPAEKIHGQIQRYGERYKNLRIMIERAMHDLDEEQREDPEAQWSIALDALTGQRGVTEQSSEGAVVLSTLHAAKGQESPSVYIAGFSHGFMPLGGDQTQDVYEERSLAYVGVTRAEQELILCHADQVNLPGRQLQVRVSPFREEIPNLVEHDLREEEEPALSP